MGNRRARLLVCLSLALCACQPIYGGKPEKLNTPAKKKRPPEVAEAAVEIKYVEECTANFTDDPRKASKQTSVATQLTQNGDAALAGADRAKDDSAKVGLLKEAIDKYRNALIKDHYHVEATLKLAIAYDRVLRKGCAIAMLKRLAALANNPKWHDEATRQIDSIDSNTGWFRGYRKDAMQAVGR